jgi:hypothetical protein
MTWWRTSYWGAAGYRQEGPELCEREGEERILRGEDSDVAYSQDRYIFHVVYIHHVHSVAVESMHGTGPVYPAPNSKETEKDDEKTMGSVQNATKSLNETVCFGH